MENIILTAHPLWHVPMDHAWSVLSTVHHTDSPQLGTDFSVGYSFVPPGAFAIYGDIFDCHIEGGANSISRVEARDAAIHKTGPYNKASSPKCQRCPSLETLIWMIRVYGTIVS